MNDWEIGGTQNKWVCPSDRHLHLRAQLKSGWSVRTSNVRSPSNNSKQENVITETEKDHIRVVLARAEEGREREQQRIGKMIDRLEKMKSRAVGNGITQCYLCATDFGLLAPKSYAAMCSQCRKYVCQKNCGVETYEYNRRESVFLCKICSEYREVMWKKSGAWFYKEIPEFVRPTDDQDQRSLSNCGKSQIGGLGAHSNHLYRNRVPSTTEPSASSQNTGLQRARITPSWVREKVQTSLSVEDENEASTSEDDSELLASDTLVGAQTRRLRSQKRIVASVAPEINRIAIGPRCHITDTEESGESRHSTPSISPRHSSSLGDDVSQNQSSIVASDAKSVDSGVVPSDYSPSHTNARLKKLPASADAPPMIDDSAKATQLRCNSFSSVAGALGDSDMSRRASGSLRTTPTGGSSSGSGVGGNGGSDSGAIIKCITPEVPLSKSDVLKAVPKPDSTSPFVMPKMITIASSTSPVVRGVVSQAHSQSSMVPSITQLTEPRLSVKSSVSRGSISSIVGDTTPPIPPRSGRSTPLLMQQQQQQQLLSFELASTLVPYESLGLRHPSDRRTPVDRKFDVFSPSIRAGDAVDRKSSTTDLSPSIKSDEPSTSSISSPAEKNNLFGSIQFSLKYQADEMELVVRLISAKNLRAMDKNGFSDPYVKMCLIPGASKATKMTSRTIEKTLNPNWYEEFTYYGISEEDRQRKTLRLLVLDRDRIGSDFLGEIRVPLKKAPLNEEKLFNLYLGHAMPVKKTSEIGDRGKIFLGLLYHVQQGSLYVTIKRCTELLGMDPTGFSDPYVRVSLLPLTSKAHRQKTSTKKRTLNPEFNETLTFVTPLKDLPKKTLQIGVYDKDVGKFDDYIGGVLLSTSARGERQRQWQACIQNPGNLIECWHKLDVIQ